MRRMTPSLRLLSLSVLLLACSPASSEASGREERSAEDASAHAQEGGQSQEQAGEKPPAKAAAKPAASDDALGTMKAFIAGLTLDKEAKNWRTQVPKPPQLTFDPKMDYFWLLETTEGPIKIRLMTDIAPMHVSSTIYLTELGFYDTLKFHRVITGFMAQGGDPLGNGRGGPAYKYAGEFSPKARHNRPGLLSMANAGPGTDGSQFFLTFVPTPHLDDKHTIFGEVVEGMDTVKQLEKFGSQGGAPSKDLAIRTAKIAVEPKAE